MIINKMPSKKKSQMSVGQIFTYVIAIIVVGFVMLFGYKSIADLREKGKEADYIQFKSQLTAAIKLTKGYGDVSQEIMSIPESYTEICFVSYYIETAGTPSSFTSNRDISKPIIENSVDDGVKKNIFLVRGNGDIESFFMDNVKVSPTLGPNGPAANDPDRNFGCIQSTAGNIKIKFEGKGDKTQIDTYT